MKKDLLPRVIVFLLFIILGLLVLEAPRVSIAVSLFVLGFCVFLVMGEKTSENVSIKKENEIKEEVKKIEEITEGDGTEDEGDDQDPFKTFLNQNIVVYLYGGDKIKGKLVNTSICYGCSGAIRLKDVQFFKDFDSGDFPQAHNDNIHEEAIIPMDHIVTVAQDDLDRVPSQ